MPAPMLLLRTDVRALLALLVMGSAAGSEQLQETFPGPASQGEQAAWLVAQQTARSDARASVNYNGSVYDDYLPWTPTMFIAPLSSV